MRGLILVMVVLMPTMAAGQEAGGAPGKQYEALAAQLKAAMEVWSKQFDAFGNLNSPEAPSRRGTVTGPAGRSPRVSSRWPSCIPGTRRR